MKSRIILILSVILFSCNHKPQNYSFAYGVVIEAKKHHCGWGYFRQRVLYKFIFNGKEYTIDELTKEKAHVYNLKYHKEDSVLIQIPDSMPEDAKLVKVVKRSSYQIE